MKWLPVGLALALASCESKEPVSREQAQTIAREAAQEAFQQLSAELAKAIESGGPVAAIPVCSTKAQTLVSEVSTRRNVAMIRLSDRPRNPRQAAGATVVRLPIIASQPLCLKCHGSAEDIAQETRAAILAVYPEDKATGYQLNDLRGIWRITVSPQPPP